MKRLIFLWNIIFGLIVAYQLYDSIIRYSGRKEIQKNIASVNKDIKKATEQKNKIIKIKMILQMKINLKDMREII